MPNRVSYTFAITNRFSRQARDIAKKTKAIRLSMKLLAGSAKVAGRAVAGSFSLMKKAAISLQSSMAPLLAAFVGIAGVFKFFSLGSNFEDAMADFGAITRTTGEDLEFVKNEALRLAKVTKTDAASIASAFKLVGSGMSELLQDKEGFSTVVENVLLLKNATGGVIELDDAATALTRSLNAFNAPAEDATRFVNVLAAGAGLGASEIQDISAAMRDAGPAAQLAKVGFEETNAALQVMAKKGATVGAQAGTKFRTIVTRLETKLRKGLRPSVIGFSNSLKALQPIMDDTTQLSLLFGEEALGQGKVLIENAALVKEWTKSFTGTNIAQEQAAKQLATLSARARGVGVSIGNFVIRAFERLTPTFEGAIKGMERFFDSISKDDVDNFVDSMRPMVDLMVNLASAVKTLAGIRPIAALGNLASESVAGVADIATLLSGEGLTAANSASFKNAARIERGRVDVQLNAPEGVVASAKASSGGKKGGGLKVGVNVVEGD